MERVTAKMNLDGLTWEEWLSAAGYAPGPPYARPFLYREWLAAVDPVKRTFDSTMPSATCAHE